MDYYSQCRSRSRVKLGAGSFGQLYDCGKYVEKVFRDVHNDDTGYETSTLREIAFTARTKHPNVILALSSYYINDEMFLYLPKYDYDLHKAISDTKLTKELIKRYNYQLTLAVAYLHQNSIVHGDIKPENVLIRDKNKIVLADLGISRYLAWPNSNGITNTSPIYASPEILITNLRGDYSLDLWQLGLVLVESITGRRLFEPKHVIDILDIETDIVELMIDWLGFPDFDTATLIKEYDDDLFEELEDYEADNYALEDIINDPKALDIVEMLLLWYPDDRRPAYQILETEYYSDYHSDNNYYHNIFAKAWPITYKTEESSQRDIRIKMFSQQYYHGSNPLVWFNGVFLYDKIYNITEINDIKMLKTTFLLSQVILDPDANQINSSGLKSEVQKVLKLTNYDPWQPNIADDLSHYYIMDSFNYDTLLAAIWILTTVVIDYDLLIHPNETIITAIITIISQYGDDIQAKDWLHYRSKPKITSDILQAFHKYRGMVELKTWFNSNISVGLKNYLSKK